jgi:hypothetical protein
LKLNLAGPHFFWSAAQFFLVWLNWHTIGTLELTYTITGSRPDQEAIDHAAQTADRWRRAYQATLRQMRDWRRYSVPVTINNPQQVNIAVDGGQQVNLQNGKRIASSDISTSRDYYGLSLLAAVQCYRAAT